MIKIINPWLPAATWTTIALLTLYITTEDFTFAFVTFIAPVVLAVIAWSNR